MLLTRPVYSAKIGAFSRALQSRSLRMSTRMSSGSSSAAASLVTPAWLHSRLGDNYLRILDGSWYMPNSGRNPKEEFRAGRIPGARFFDMNAVADTDTDLPHMLPSEGAFSAAADALGIGPDTQVVVYDGAGVFSAPRVWWTFRAFGHDRVAVLDGGLPAWKAEGYPLDTQSIGEEEVDAAASAARQPGASGRYPAKLQPGLVRSLEQVRANIGSREAAVVDARGAGRFSGAEAEPRPGVRAGHIPGSLNVPFTQVLKEGRFKGPEDLAAVFQAAGLDMQRPIIASCGTGVTASVLALALHQLSPASQVSVYDGSWTEWGSAEDTPVETGRA